MYEVILWLAVMIAMMAAEAATISLVSIWFAGGALCALVAALCGGSIVLQIVLFVAVSAVLLACLWPLRKKLLDKKRQPTNLDRVIGMTAVVTEPVDNIAGAGAVKVDGKVWSARSEDGSRLSAGDLVEVRRIEGVKLYVVKSPVKAV